MSNKLNSVKQALKKYDLFSGQPEIYFNQKRQFGTLFGTLLSLCAVIIVIFQSYSLLFQFWAQTDPQIQITSNYSTRPFPIHIDTTNFSIGIGVFINNTNVPLDSSIFEVTFHRKYCPRNGSCAELDLGVQKCNHSDLIKDFFNNQKIDLFCPQNLTMDFTGRQLREIISGGETSFLEIDVIACKNGSTPKVVCKPVQEIEAILGNSYNEIEVFAFFTNQYYYPTSSPPLRTFLDAAGGAWPLSMQRTMDLFMDLTIIQKNEGILFDDYTFRQMYSVNPNSVSNTYTTRNPETSYFKMNLRRSPETITMDIENMQITEALSLVGGFAKTVFFFFGIIVLSYNREKYKVEISNTLYNFQEKKKKSKRKTVASQNLDDSSINLELVQKRDHPGSLEGITQLIKPQLQPQKNIGLRYSFFDWMRTNICPCLKSPYKEVVNQAYGLAVKAIDIAEIVKKIQEIDKLKEVLLTADQQKLFEYIPKKVIQEKAPDPKRRKMAVEGGEIELITASQVYKLRDNFEYFESYESLFFAYEKLKRDPSPENQKLIQMLSQETLTAFEEISITLRNYEGEEKIKRFRELYYFEHQDQEAE